MRSSLPRGVVYPRPRGEALIPASAAFARRGLSPPTRGSHHPNRADLMASRSIPAHAGEPRECRQQPHVSWVYPRPRGGALRTLSTRGSSTGLSPPTRGSPPHFVDSGLIHGSIPAHAGEPFGVTGGSPSTTVYPRPRGGALVAHLTTQPFRGLSPPTRGSRLAARYTPPSRGSIPAHAGEPVSAASRWRLSGVYPRPRGGAYCA